MSPQFFLLTTLDMTTMKRYMMPPNGTNMPVCICAQQIRKLVKMFPGYFAVTSLNSDPNNTLVPFEVSNLEAFE